MRGEDRGVAADQDLLLGFELHSEDAIRSALAAGAHPLRPINGKPPLQLLVEIYTRSPRFAGCLRVMINAGATLDDPALQAVLLDDVPQLEAAIRADPESIPRKRSLECAYTSLQGVSLLHVAAEYNSVETAGMLLARGMNVDLPAAVDEAGMGGQTPLFHSVNRNHNHSREVMELLVEGGASLDVRLQGVVWGAGFEWETVIYDVSPISYAQCGLYFQFHRRESEIYSNLVYLHQKRYGILPKVRNVPNRYLSDQRVFPPRT
jgi:hypothetical protein